MTRLFAVVLVGSWVACGCGGGTTPGGETPGGELPGGETPDAPSGDVPNNGASTDAVLCGTTEPANGVRALRVYVAGESIEQRNHFVAPPFSDDGRVSDRGSAALRNDNDEYGWSIPMAERLHRRAPTLAVRFVGSGSWTDGDDNPYSGTYPCRQAQPTSAIAGTSIDSWLDQRRPELVQKSVCYDVAFASRGGNDFGNEDDADYQAQLEGLIDLLAHGSSCQANPVIYVTGHLPDDQRGGSGPSDSTYVAQQVRRFVTRTKAAVDAYRAGHAQARVHFVDQYTPFLENKATIGFPSETWSTNGVPDYAKIGREGDLMHPRRLASIYAGELAADAMDLAELQ